MATIVWAAVSAPLSETLCDMIKQWKPNGWARELGQIKSGVGPFLEKRAREPLQRR
jgi:hypothetical protein